MVILTDENKITRDEIIDSIEKSHAGMSVKIFLSTSEYATGNLL